MPYPVLEATQVYRYGTVLDGWAWTDRELYSQLTTLLTDCACAPQGFIPTYLYVLSGLLSWGFLPTSA